MVKVMPDKVWGDWTCRCGESELKRTTAAEAQGYHCETCGHPLDIYQEIDLVDHELQVTGHPDLILIHNGVFEVVEFKSCKRDDFEDRRDGKQGEDNNHALQALYYRRMLEKTHPGSELVQNTIRLVYINKDFV